MATVVADTSFLISLFGNDAHTGAAQNWAVHFRQPITVSSLNCYELENALRFAAFRRAITLAEALGSISAFAADLKRGNIRLAPCDLSAVVAEASRLSELHTINGGHRSFDILHVATAGVLKASTFLTFDENQRRLAATMRLNVGP